MSMQITVGDDRDDDREDDTRGVDRDDEDEVDRGGREADRRRGRQDDDTDEDDSDDEEPEDGWAAEARRLRAALKKANSTGQRRRQQLKDLQAAKRNAADDEPEDDEDEKPAAKDRALDARTLQREIDKAKKAARKEADEEHRRELLTLKAESRLSAAGVSEKAVRLLKKEIDFDDFELDPEDEIDRLRVEYPDLFKRTRSSGRRINGGDDRDSGGKRRPMTATEQQVAKLTRGARS